MAGQRMNEMRTNLMATVCELRRFVPIHCKFNKVKSVSDDNDIRRRCQDTSDCQTRVER